MTRKDHCGGVVCLRCFQQWSPVLLLPAGLYVQVLEATPQTRVKQWEYPARLVWVGATLPESADCVDHRQLCVVPQHSHLVKDLKGVIPPLKHIHTKFHRITALHNLRQYVHRVCDIRKGEGKEECILAHGKVQLLWGWAPLCCHLTKPLQLEHTCCCRELALVIDIHGAQYQIIPALCSGCISSHFPFLPTRSRQHSYHLLFMRKQISNRLDDAFL
mmetsp:Transcript_22011/g.31943  ORF Transcript_22011/g.31943 Transcript_22011/m.31943 type:complete len:217 (-) Transcript_22011:418-1068(-)